MHTTPVEKGMRGSTLRGISEIIQLHSTRPHIIVDISLKIRFVTESFGRKETCVPDVASEEDAETAMVTAATVA